MSRDLGDVGVTQRRWEGPHAPEEMARASSTMYFVAATAVLGFVALAPWPELPRVALASLAAPGYAAAIFVRLTGERLTVGAHHALAFAGMVLTSTGVHLAGGTPGAVALSMLYAWIAVFAFTFFSWRAALAHTLVAATTGATILAINTPREAASIGIMLLATLLVCGGTAGWLVRKVRRLAQTDALTGLPNRRVLEHVLTVETARARRFDEPLCVSVLDLDGFKHVNDREGHVAGDRLLREVARAWSAQLRATDFLARFGGDEFTLVLPATNLAEAPTIVDRLRAATPSPLTCSVGLTQWDGAEPIDAALVRADRALYAAKANGRDCVVTRV